MIKVQDWIASIPEEEKHIAYVGEGMTEQREFLLCGEGWEKYTRYGFHLDMAFDPVSITTRDCRQVVQTTVNSAEHKEEAGVTKDEVTTKETYSVCDEEVLNYDLTDVASLDKWVEEEGIRLTWTVLRQHTQLPGKLKATIRAVGEDPNCIKKSAMMVFEVEPSVAAVPAAVPPISEFSQMESEMDNLRQLAVEAAEEAMRHATTAASAAQGAAEACDTAVGAADAAQMSADTAVSAANGAAQAQYAAADHAARAEVYRAEASAQANAAVTACADAKQQAQIATEQAVAAAYDRVMAAEILARCGEQVAMAETAAETAVEARIALTRAVTDVGDLTAAVFDLEEVPPSANLWNPDTAEYREIGVGLMGYYNIIPCTVDDHFWVRTTDDRSVTDVDNHSVMLAISIIGANGVKVSCGANQWYQREVSFFAENGYFSAIDEVVAIEIGVRENQIPDGNPANVMVVFSDTKPTEFIPYFEGGVVKHSRIAPLQEQVDELDNRMTDIEGNTVELDKRVTNVEKAVVENTASVEKQLAEMQEKVDTAGSGRVKIRNTPIEDKCLQFTSMLHGKDKVESFLYFTDPHLGTLGLNYEDLTHEYVDPVKVYYDATPTTFVLSGGDTAHENTADVAGVAYRLAFVDGYMRKTFDRYYPTVGNHDDNWKGLWDDPDKFSTSTVRNLMLRQEENLYYSFAGVNSMGYVLNSTDNERRNQDYEMSTYLWEQVAWLAQRLKEDDADNSFLLYHAGYTRRDGYPNGRDLSAFSKEVLKLCEAYNNSATITLNGATYDFAGCTGCVRFVLSGHIHDANCVETHNGIPVITTYNLRRLGERGKGDNPTFDLCLADYDNEVLYMRRVGDGRDRDVLMSSRSFEGHTYSVTLNLTNVNVSNYAVLAREGTAYENTLTVPYGYARDSVVVTMGGVDITATAYSGGQISIGSVTGDITITATAIEPNYTNLADPTSADWVRGGCLQWQTLVTTTIDTYAVTNYIPVTMGDVLRFKGFDSETKMSGGIPPMIVYYDENKAYVAAQSLIDGLPPTAEPDENGVIAHTVVVRNTDLDGNGLYDDQFTHNDICTRAKYVRISGIRTVPADEIVITVNEEIE